MRAAVVGLLFLGTSAGCMAAGMNLHRASARAIVPTPYPDSVTISEVHHGVLISRWVATTHDGVYDCSIEANEKVAICAKRQPPR
jgi:hypothetical protein